MTDSNACILRRRRIAVESHSAAWTRDAAVAPETAGSPVPRRRTAKGADEAGSFAATTDEARARQFGSKEQEGPAHIRDVGPVPERADPTPRGRR
jgi:hypothetical protein